MWQFPAHLFFMERCNFIKETYFFEVKITKGRLVIDDGIETVSFIFVSNLE